MAIKLNQSLKQTQTLTMTPQLQQAIKLLTLTHMEMTSAISEEMMENPMLEELGGAGDEKVKSEVDYKEERLSDQNQEASAESFDEKPIVERDDFDLKSYIEDYNNTSSTAPSMVSRDSDDQMNYENVISQEMSLADHLDWQLKMAELDEEEWKVASRVVYNINDDGYLDIPFEEIIADSGVDRELAFDVLHMVQELDPVGCGAQNLQECLLAQARIADERSPLLEKLITNHLEDLQRRDYKKICSSTGVDEEVVKQTALLLQNFHPKPGRLVAPAETHYVTPDIYIYEVAGEFLVKVNDDGVPRLRISKIYQQMLQNSEVTGDKEAKGYVEERVRSAMWLIKSIQNRQRTIEKVAKAILAKQQMFFKKGPEHLKPMILKDVAQEIEMHESTVSRVTTNKYMHTPIGMFELKYFFNAGVGGKDGGVDVSGEVLKLKIKAIVASENPKRPLSDQKLAELLSKDDIKVARRTVAKYREILGILSSSKRKVK
ncbi:MAG: RNA polymerase factor sigma-54 [Bacteriovoracaceae bacterium]|nr:RNA polymerase factor sigma-54 [Bacteriovoracaceae bacterium]